MDRSAGRPPMPPSEEVLRWQANRPPMGTVGEQPYPLRLAIYVLSWSFVICIVLSLFLPLAVAGLRRAGWL